jgi:hypothetical protein
MHQSSNTSKVKGISQSKTYKGNYFSFSYPVTWSITAHSENTDSDVVDLQDIYNDKYVFHYIIKPDVIGGNNFLPFQKYETVNVGGVNVLKAYTNDCDVTSTQYGIINCKKFISSIYYTTYSKNSITKHILDRNFPIINGNPLVMNAIFGVMQMNSSAFQVINSQLDTIVSSLKFHRDSLNIQPLTQAKGIVTNIDNVYNLYTDPDTGITITYSKKVITQSCKYWNPSPETVKIYKDLVNHKFYLFPSNIDVVTSGSGNGEDSCTLKQPDTEDLNQYLSNISNTNDRATGFVVSEIDYATVMNNNDLLRFANSNIDTKYYRFNINNFSTVGTNIYKYNPTILDSTLGDSPPPDFVTVLYNSQKHLAVFYSKMNVQGDIWQSPDSPEGTITNAPYANIPN